MSYITEHITNTLKAARVGNGLSQRELSAKSGVPQSHISKIESGAVDLRVSSLVALARVLDLELTLVPRKAVSAVKSIVRSTETTARESGKGSREALKELKRLQDNLARSIQTHTAVKELAQLQRQVWELQRFTLTSQNIEALRQADKAVKTFRDNVKGMEALRRTLAEVQSMRNALAHRLADVPQIESARPAYILDEDDNG